MVIKRTVPSNLSFYTWPGFFPHRGCFRVGKNSLWIQFMNKKQKYTFVLVTSFAILICLGAYVIWEATLPNQNTSKKVIPIEIKVGDVKSIRLLNYNNTPCSVLVSFFPYSSPTTKFKVILLTCEVFCFGAKDVPNDSFSESIKPVQWLYRHHNVSVAEQLLK